MDVTRRRFLETSVGAGAGIAASRILKADAGRCFAGGGERCSTGE